MRNAERDVRHIGAWNLRNLGGHKGRPYKIRLLDSQMARFYVYDVGATLVVAQISKVPDSKGHSHAPARGL